LTIITSSAAWEKISSTDVRIGLLAAANDLAAKLASGLLAPGKAAIAPQLIFNQRLDAVLILFFVCMLWLIVFDMLRVCVRYLKGKPVPPLSEVSYQLTRMEKV
jgi:carbon starvation protein